MSGHVLGINYATSTFLDGITTPNGNSYVFAYDRTNDDIRFLNGLVAGGFRLSKRRSLKTKTANYSIVAADDRVIFDNIAAAGIVVFSLPAAARDLAFAFLVDAAHSVQINAHGSDTISWASTTSAAGGNIQSIAPNSYLELVSFKTGAWVATVINGDWSIT